MIWINAASGHRPQYSARPDRRCADMIPADIHDIARALISHHGSDAVARARAIARANEACGEEEGREMWERIADAIAKILHGR
jgi:hypothetical protein